MNAAAGMKWRSPVLQNLMSLSAAFRLPRAFCQDQSEGMSSGLPVLQPQFTGSDASFLRTVSFDSYRSGTQLISLFVYRFRN
jgi:hypothetical protein